MINKNVMVQATDLCRYFGSGETLVKAIDKISFLSIKVPLQSY